MPKAVIFILIGAVGIAVGGDVVVDSASRIAIDLGMSQTLVGLTIVSIGTSIPELVTSIVAARKNEVDMALGNAVGSCIFNILYNIIWLEIKLKFINFVRTQNRYYNGGGIYIIFVIDHAETTACLG